MRGSRASVFLTNPFAALRILLGALPMQLLTFLLANEITDNSSSPQLFLDSHFYQTASMYRKRVKQETP